MSSKKKLIGYSSEEFKQLLQTSNEGFRTGNKMSSRITPVGSDRRWKKNE